MKAMKKRILILLGILLLLFGTATAYADEPPPPPTPWYRDLGDGYVFHYRPEYDHYHLEEFFCWGTPTEFKEQGYPQTGLYRDGELVYTVEVPIWGGLVFSNDRMTFIEIYWAAWATGDPGIPARYREPIGPAMRFFDQGELMHVFEVPDLVRNQSRLAFTVSHVKWDYHRERYRDQENDTFQVTTRDGRVITFDLTNGLILSSQRLPLVQRTQLHSRYDPWFWDNILGNPVVGWTILIVAFSAFVFIVFIVVRFLRRRIKDLR